ncbi:MAG: hypothetical protein DRP45_07405 [Candidatus Zixiibacteriota bacterium]|nr:MAG: hypothetical protein DRP45_07405 [candidate division Zixibacteria bacterium]
MKTIMDCKGRHPSILWTAIAVVVMLVVTVGGAFANDQFVMTATGTVRAALSIAQGQALNWSQGGDLYMGVSKHIAVNTAGAGVFTVTGAAADNIQSQLLLPEYLWCATAGVKQRVDVYFTATDAAYSTDGDADPTTATQTVVDPTNLPTMTVAAGQTDVNIFLGGTAMPSANQKAGVYTASVVLTSWYEGD